MLECDNANGWFDHSGNAPRNAPAHPGPPRLQTHDPSGCRTG